MIWSRRRDGRRIRFSPSRDLVLRAMRTRSSRIVDPHDDNQISGAMSLVPAQRRTAASALSNAATRQHRVAEGTRPGVPFTTNRWTPTAGTAGFSIEDATAVRC